jgi:hypothetical protein
MGFVSIDSFAPVEPTPAKIVIRLLNIDNPDDILTLDPDMNSTGFNVVFNQYTTRMKTEHLVEYDCVVEYLEAFFKSLMYDTDPKSSYQVQVEIPGLPCVLLKKTNLIAYLYGVVDNYLDQLRLDDEWPLEYRS